MHVSTLPTESGSTDFPAPAIAAEPVADTALPVAPEIPAAVPEVPVAVQALRSFRAIFGALRHHFQEVERLCGVSGSQLWALSVVVATPGIRVKDLAQAMAVHQSTASNLVEQLVRQLLISRVRDRADQRIVQLYPTDAGRAVVDRVPRPLDGLLPDVLARLAPERLAVLNDLLAEVARGMRVHGR
jgi:DNA-binding MarR family transcriptional regulator